LNGEKNRKVKIIFVGMKYLPFLEGNDGMILVKENQRY
jgi:hypothetical protein